MRMFPTRKEGKRERAFFHPWHGKKRKGLSTKNKPATQIEQKEEGHRFLRVAITQRLALRRGRKGKGLDPF